MVLTVLDRSMRDGAIHTHIWPLTQQGDVICANPYLIFNLVLECKSILSSLSPASASLLSVIMHGI